MNTANHKWEQDQANWEHIGRAAESFARRVARDAGKFAERLEEHASEFARDLSHEWRHARRHARAVGGASADDVRHVLDDVRRVLVDILEGVDEFIGRLFPPAASQAEPPAGTESGRESGTESGTESGWMRMVSNRVVACAACGRSVEAGEEACFRHGPEGVDFRCVDCGAPASESH
jgi:hypothetical protein